MIGQVVKFTDENGVIHDALVIYVHSQPNKPDEECLVNLVHVDSDAAKFDNYGRQITRRTSVCPAGQYGAIFGWAPIDAE